MRAHAYSNLAYLFFKPKTNSLGNKAHVLMRGGGWNLNPTPVAISPPTPLFFVKDNMPDLDQKAEMKVTELTYNA